MSFILDSREIEIITNSAVRAARNLRMSDDIYNEFIDVIVKKVCFDLVIANEILASFDLDNVSIIYNTAQTSGKKARHFFIEEDKCIEESVSIESFMPNVVIRTCTRSAETYVDNNLS